MVSDGSMANWSGGIEDPDPIALREIGGDKFWIHRMGQLEKPLATRVGVAGHVTSDEK